MGEQQPAAGGQGTGWAIRRFPGGEEAERRLELPPSIQTQALLVRRDLRPRLEPPGTQRLEDLHRP